MRLISGRVRVEEVGFKPNRRHWLDWAERLRPLLDNSRRLGELLSELEALALRHVENDPAQPHP